MRSQCSVIILQAIRFDPRGYNYIDTHLTEDMFTASEYAALDAKWAQMRTGSLQQQQADEALFTSNVCPGFGSIVYVGGVALPSMRKAYHFYEVRTKTCTKRFTRTHRQVILRHAQLRICNATNGDL